ncbi:MAG: MFS transporter [Prevotella sp.]|nr:MFS transporter [Prevotella sp.]
MEESRILFKEKVGYSLGDFAANLMFQVMMVFQLKFYTDVFGLDGAVAGSVLFIALVADIIVDPMVGVLTDQTHTRWGKYRPWILWTALPFSVFYVLAFYNPGIQDKTLVAVYATVSYILMVSVYSFNNTPYTSLGGVMTSNIRERTSITSIRFIASTVAQFVVQGLTLPLVSRFGGENMAKGWLYTIILYASLAFICFIITFFSTRERVEPPAQQVANIHADISETLSNSSWRTVFILTICLFLTVSMWGAATSFYFQYYVDQHALFLFLSQWGLMAGLTEADAYSIGFSLFNMVGAVVQFIGVILLSQYLSNRFGKKSTFIVCLALTALFTALFYLPDRSDISLMFVFCFLKSLAYAPTIPLLWAMTADVADHIEYVNHRRATGFCFSGVVLGLKLGLGLGGAFAGIILSLFGYVSGRIFVQDDSAIFGIQIVTSVIPAILFFVGVVVLFFYPITKDFNERIQRELVSRRRVVIEK